MVEFTPASNRCGTGTSLCINSKLLKVKCVFLFPIGYIVTYRNSFLLSRRGRTFLPRLLNFTIDIDLSKKVCYTTQKEYFYHEKETNDCVYVRF